MRRERLVAVFTVCVDGYSMLDPGAGDGTLVRRFARREWAEEFARGKTHWGHPATVHEEEVPASLADRWGV